MTNNTDHRLPAEDVSGLFLSLFLEKLDIKNTISAEDENLIFINYEGITFDSEDIEPLLSIYLDQDSKFARFTIINSAPKQITKKNIGSLIDALNKNYVLLNYDSTESDGNFFISGEYWLNYKFGFNASAAHSLIMMMPSILSGALRLELDDLK